jgi:uncharacterized protein
MGQQAAPGSAPRRAHRSASHDPSTRSGVWADSYLQGNTREQTGYSRNRIDKSPDEVTIEHMFAHASSRPLAALEVRRRNGRAHHRRWASKPITSPHHEGRRRQTIVTALLEIRDPVHNFIGVTANERRVIDSVPVQRLRHIHQLAMSYLVYPGATHRRFEHSLGVMHLAGEAFDVITRPEHLTDQVRELVPEVMDDETLPYWRTVVRLAALCHDLGHLPFSHGAEHELLPVGYSHERLSMDLIKSEEFSSLLSDLLPPLHDEVLAKLAVGPDKAGAAFNNWEAILSEIIVGDAFGVDRMDYLLRDSLHAGVQYGRFDHHRLLSNLRILPSALTGEDDAETEPALGVAEGGLHAAESLLLARYFMWTQVYLHPVRVMYDAHLQDFLSQWLPGGTFSVDLDTHLGMTDLEVLVAMRTGSQRCGGRWARPRLSDRESRALSPRVLPYTQ